jgi:hypothetical protein
VVSAKTTPGAISAYDTPAFEPENLDPWQRLAEIIRARNPKKIFAFVDGLTSSNKALLVRAIGPELAIRIVPAERVILGS